MRKPIRSLVVLGLLLAGSPARGDAEEAGAKAFETPEAAIAALRTALETNDDAALRALAGPGGEDVVQGGNDPTVQADRKKVAALAKQAVEFETLDDGTEGALLGNTKWPLPIPLVRSADGWRFDVKQARDEILARRIGTNELRVMQVLAAIVDAQKVYRSVDRDGDGVLEYAQKFVSTEGTRDGLWWPKERGETLETRSPLGAMLGDMDVSAARQSKTFSGYRWKLLTARGPHGRGGAASYVRGSDLVDGFGVLAVPVDHRKTGVMSFVVSHRGVVFEKDLGPGGGDAFATITSFDPDASWTPVAETEVGATPTPPSAGGTGPGCAPVRR